MTLPFVTLTRKDGGITTIALGANLHAKIGASEKGTTNTLYAFYDKDSAKNALGQGPLADAVSVALAEAGGPVYAVRTPTSAPATPFGAVTHTGTGTGTVVPSATASTYAFDDYALLVQIVAGGGLGVATFQWSLDGGNTWSRTTTVPAGGTYAIDGNITLTFAGAPATFVAGDTYAAAVAGPVVASADVTAAMDVVKNSGTVIEFVHVLAPADHTLTATVEAQLEGYEAAGYYLWAMLEARDMNSGEAEAAWMTAIETDFATTVAPLCDVAAGFVDIAIPATSRVQRRSCAWFHAARAAKVPIHEDLGQVDRGPATVVTKLYHDEQLNPGLHDARFSTMRTYFGLIGNYITSGRMMAASGSDYAYLPAVRVIHAAMQVARPALLFLLNGTERVNPATVAAPLVPGAIDERDARTVEGKVDTLLAQALTNPKHATAASVTLDRTISLADTEEISATVGVTPLGYVRGITATFGMTL